MLENLFLSLKYSGKYTQFLDMLEIAGFSEAIKSNDQFTIFAPSDEAIAKLSKTYKDNLYKDLDALKLVISRHIIPGIIRMNELENIPSISLENSILNIIKNDNGIFIENAKIISYDQDASNGIYYELDSLILPEEKK